MAIISPPPPPPFMSDWDLVLLKDTYEYQTKKDKHDPEKGKEYRGRTDWGAREATVMATAVQQQRRDEDGGDDGSFPCRNGRGGSDNHRMYCTSCCGQRSQVKYIEKV